MIFLFQVPAQPANKGGFQPKIAAGKEHENIHEQEHELKFHFFSFFFVQAAGVTLDFIIRKNVPKVAVRHSNYSQETFGTVLVYYFQ